MTGVKLSWWSESLLGGSSAAIFNPATMLGLVLMIVATSLAFNNDDVFCLWCASKDPFGAASHVRHPQYAAVFPQRVGSIPSRPFRSGLRAPIRLCRSVYLPPSIGFKCLLLKEDGAECDFGGMTCYFSTAARLQIALGIAIPLFQAQRV